MAVRLAAEVYEQILQDFDPLASVMNVIIPAPILSLKESIYVFLPHSYN